MQIKRSTYELFYNKISMCKNNKKDPENKYSQTSKLHFKK